MRSNIAVTVMSNVKILCPFNDCFFYCKNRTNMQHHLISAHTNIEGRRYCEKKRLKIM